MSQAHSLIYRKNINSPNFKLSDTQLTSFPSSPLKLPSESTTMTRFHERGGSFNQSMTPSLPSIQNEFQLSFMSPRTQNSSVASNKDLIQITHLYKSPRPYHQRMNSDIPNISVKNLDIDLTKHFSEEQSISKPYPEITNVMESFKDSVTLPKKQLSGSTSLHPLSLTQSRLPEYLKYLDEHSKPSQLRKAFEEKIYSKHPIPRNHSNTQDSVASYKLVQLPSTINLAKSGSIEGRGSHFSQLTRNPSLPSFDSQMTFSPKYDPIKESNFTTAVKAAKPSKLQPIAIKSSSEDGSPQSNSIKKSTSKNLSHSHSRRAGYNSEIHWHNQYSELFSDIAHNLSSLHHLIANEKKVHSTIEKFAGNNNPVINLCSSKYHKILDYDIEKLQRKYSLIEVTSENLSVPQKLEKQRLGLSLVEPSVVRDLTYFNEKLEEFILHKKQENLKLIEDRIINSENKLWEIQQKKLNEMKEKRRVKEYDYAEKILSQKPRIDPYYFFQFDPVSTIENYQKNNGELKYVKKKHVEHARTIAEVFGNWISHVNKD